MVRCRNSSICFLEFAPKARIAILQHRTIVTHHYLPQQFDGRETLLQHLIVKFFQ